MKYPVFFVFQKTVKYFPKYFLTLFAVVAFACAANAQTTDTLQHLADTNGSFTIGDKTFSNLAFNASNLTNLTHPIFRSPPPSTGGSII